MAHQTREPQLTAHEQQLLRLLRQGAHAVIDLAQALRIPPTHIAHLLESLDRKVGLVHCSRSGRVRYGLAE